MDTEKAKLLLADKLRQHVYKLAHEIGDRSVYIYKELNDAAAYITGQFKQYGYDVEFQDYTVGDKTVKNIIATKAGKQTPEEMIIIGAHYDTCFNPGADDNASAVAGLLELSRYMFDKQTNRTIRFIAFTNEEPPFFKTEKMGSRVYAREAKARGEKIKAVLVLESIGYYSDKPHSQSYPPFFRLFYPDKGNYIAVVGNFNSRWLVNKVVSSFKRHSDFPIKSTVMFSFVPGIDWSDHWSFWKEGYPAVMVTDTAIYRNPNYHGSGDTYEKLDYDRLAEVVRGLNTVLAELSK